MKRHLLRVERELRGWSQARVAEEIGTSTRTVVRWEQGEVLPQPYYRERLCALFGKNALELGLQPLPEGAESSKERLPDPSLFSLSGTMTAPSDETPISSEQAQALTASLGEDPLLSTKLLVPAPRHGLIQRPRLTDLLMAGMKCALTLVSAPAGSGKTTLIAEWVRSFVSPGFAAWVSLDEEDNGPACFWLYVLVALESRQPGLYFPLISAIRSHQVTSWSTFVKHLLNTLLERRQSIFLVLDDYHVITNPVIHNVMTYFVEHLPSHVHLLITTRSDPPWALSRLRLQGQLQEIRMHQLSGTAEEVGAFFSQVAQFQLPSAIIEEITTRTEGWMAGIQLLALSLRELSDMTDILDMLQGGQRHIFDYLMEEVISNQSPLVQEFLLYTSILERLSAECCDVVRGSEGSQEILEFLDHANLFVVPLDQQRQWYRYHHLFAQALRARLESTYSSNQIRVLHLRASIWFAQNGSLRETISHALSAQEWTIAVEAIDRMPFEQVWSSQHILLQQWIESLPAAILRQYPCLCLRYATLLLWRAHFNDCKFWLDEAEQALLAQGTDVHRQFVPALEQPKLFGKCLNLRALAAMMCGKGEEAVSLCQQAAHYFEEQDLSLRAQTAFYLGQARYVCDQSSQAIQTLREAMSLADMTEDWGVQDLIRGSTIVQLSILGCLKQAWSVAEDVSTLQQTLVFNSIPWSQAYKAEILREWNHLEAAIKLAEQAIQRGRESEMVLLLPHWYAILAHCLFSKGDFVRMEQTIQHAEHLNEQLHDPMHLGSYITVERVRLWLARGDMDSANRWAQRYREQEDEPSVIARVLQDIAFIRVLIANKEYTEARHTIEQALQQAQAAQRKAHILELLVLQALVHQATREEAAACVSLSDALSLAQEQGYIRLFVDEGQPMAHLLLKLKQQHASTSYIDVLLNAFSPTRD